MTSLAIGESGGQKLVFTKAERDTHLHVIGASGTGKSFFLESLLRKDISAGNGVCFIDPHGQTIKNVLEWMTATGMRARQVHLIQPGTGEHSVGFNPLCLPGSSASRRVGDMVNAFERVWGGNSTTDTPRLRKCLRATLYALAHHKMSLLEAGVFTGQIDLNLRDHLISQLPRNGFDEEWAELTAYPPKEFREYFESTRTRIFEFVTSPAIRPIIGQTKDVLDFSTCMEQGHVVLVNLAESGTFTKQEGQLLGAMITADLYSSARQRETEKAKHKPFYCYIDECSDYLNEDIAKSLDETRKFGLHFVLSHQRLQQLRDVSDNCFDAVMSNAQAKVVFRLGDEDSADIMCRHMLRSQFDLERPKESMNRPVATGQQVIDLYGSSTTEVRASATSESVATGEGESEGTSTFVPKGTEQPDAGEVGGFTELGGESAYSVAGSSASLSQANSETISSSQSLATVYEVMPTQLYSLEEIIHLGINSIRQMPNRHALVKIGSQDTAQVKTLDVRNYAPLPLQLNRRIAALAEQSQFTRTTADVEDDIEARRDPEFEVIDEDDVDDEDTFRVSS